MAIKIALLLALTLLVGALAQPTFNHVIAGAFSAVDSIDAGQGLATFAHAGSNIGDTRRYANGHFVPQFVGTDSIPGSVGGNTRVYADDGSIFAVDSTGSELFLYDNRTHSAGSRLFGTNGFFGFDTATSTRASNLRPASNYVGLIQNIAVVGAYPTRTLLVCVAVPGSQNRIVVGTSNTFTSPNGAVTPGDTFGAFPPQLIAFSEAGQTGQFTPGFGGGFVFGGTPVLVTPSYRAGSTSEFGVDCSTLFASNNVFVVKANSGPWFHSPAGVTSASWVQLSRDPNASPSVGGAIETPLDLATFYIQDTTGTPAGKYVYYYGPNPNPLTTSPTESDFVPSFYRLQVGSNGASGSSWTPVFSSLNMRNVSVSEYVVGFGGDNEIYFTATASPSSNTIFPNSLLDNTYFPLSRYVFRTNGQSSNSFDYLDKNWRLSGPTLNLHYETEAAPGSNTPGYIVVYGAGVGKVTFGNQFQYNLFSPGLVSGVSYDTQFYSKQYNSIIRYDASLTPRQWVQAYGGGFDSAPSYIFSATNSKTTHFEGVDKAYQTFTGPIAAFHTENNLNRWGVGYGITGGVPDFDGGADANGIYSDAPLVTVVLPYRLSGRRGWIVGGYFRTLDNGQTIANSLVFIPASNPGQSGGAKAVFADSNGGNTQPIGVRYADLSSGNRVPENAIYSPGSVTDAVIVGDHLAVAGTFNLAGNKYTSNFAVYNLRTNAWDNAFGGVDGTVNDLLAQGDYVYVGGSFSRVGQNVLARNVARYNVKTGQWSVLNRGIDGTVNKLLNYGGRVLALGDFTTGSGQTLNNVGLWHDNKWAPLAFYGGNNESSVCVQKFCTLGELSNDEVVDGAVVNGNLYVAVAGSGIYKYRGHGHGWVNVDGGAQNGGASNGVVSQTFSFVRGGQYIAPGVNDAEVDYWNYNYNGAYPSENVVTYNTDKANWVDNNFKGVNGPVYFVAPQTTGAASSAFVVAASASFLLAIVFALLML